MELNLVGNDGIVISSWIIRRSPADRDSVSDLIIEDEMFIDLENVMETIIQSVEPVPSDEA